MSEQKKKVPVKKDAKPWEKMYQGKKNEAGKAGSGKAGANKANTNKSADAKNAGGKANAGKKAAPEFLDFLYLLPKKTSAKDFAKVLTFLKPEDVEVWEDECVIEITTDNGTITFEDIRESLEREDEKVLSDLRMKQVLSCDYEKTDRELVRKIMRAVVDKFGGKIGSDTEDFTPFVEPEEL